MTTEKAPSDFNELFTRADSLRDEIVREAGSLRWCWTAVWNDELKEYRLGVQFEGQNSWRNCGPLQSGCGETAFDWVRRLNELENLSEQAQREITNSYNLGARSCLTEDEEHVSIQVEGASWSWDVAPTAAELFERVGLERFPTCSQGKAVLRCIFTLEYDFANDLVTGLSSLRMKGRLPIPSG